MRIELHGAAIAGVADGVTEQVFEALRQTFGIDADQAGFDHAGIIEAHFTRLEGIGEAQADFSHDIEQADIGTVDRHFAGVDLGHIEHIVDRPRQFLRRRLDRVEIGLLFWVLVGL